MAETEQILHSVDGPVGRIRLNNPKALNSLTEAMCKKIHELLTDWADDEAIHAVIVTGEGDRAFCAGGDVRQVCNAGYEDPVAARHFFQVEYAMDLAIAQFPKPYICMIDGIVMGGGLGISVNGRYRVLGTNIMAAMPETGIGLLPDVGATRFLNACPGRIGMYLGLTGARMDTADALFVGFGTHHVPSGKFDELLNAFTNATYEGEGFSTVDHVLSKFAVSPGESKLAARQAAIDGLFASDDVEAIMTELENDGSDLAAEAILSLQGMSPTSLKITAKQLADHPNFSVRDSLILEYRMVANVLQRHDFYEGIRAALIDKDRQPKWNPATLPEVSADEVSAHFETLGAQELALV